MQYLNNKTNAYETAAEHFDYKFDHDKSNCVAWSYEGLEDYADENGVDVDKMIADGIIEVDYESGNWYIDPEDDSIIWNYLIDDDNDNDDDNDTWEDSRDEDEDDELMVYIGDVQHETMDMQAAIDEDAEGRAEYYGFDRLRHSVTIHEEEEYTTPEDGVQVSLSWSSIGAVTLDEAEEFVKILQKAIDEGKRACCTGMHVTYDINEATYSPYGTIDDYKEQLVVTGVERRRSLDPNIYDSWSVTLTEVSYDLYDAGVRHNHISNLEDDMRRRSNLDWDRMHVEWDDMTEEARAKFDADWETMSRNLQAVRFIRSMLMDIERDEGDGLGFLDPYKHAWDDEDDDTEDMHESYEELKAALEQDYETGRELAYFIDAEEPDIEVEDINRIVDEMVTEKNRIVERFNADLEADLDRAVMLDHNSYILMRAALELEFWDGTAKEYDDDDEELPF